MPQPGAGQLVAGWRLIRRLGEGAQSQVWLAGRPAPERLELAALKLLPLADESSELGDSTGRGLAAARDAFLAQAAIVGTLDHPGIARVHDAGIDGSRAWLAMEPVPGCDLVRYTQSARRLPDAVVLSILERVAWALAHAHARGVFHRDLKPANVIVDWAGDAVKLVDFGLARVEGGLRTGTGIVPGTPAYMAPELLAGAAPDARTDLYALGVMAFELLAGERPHDARTLGELLRQVAHEAAPPLDTRRPELLPDVTTLVASLLAKPPAARAADAGDVAEALARCRRAAGAPSRAPGSHAP